MKFKPLKHFFGGAFLLLTMTMINPWLSAQTAAPTGEGVNTPIVTDPSVDNPNYNSEKLMRYTQLRTRNGDSQTEVSLNTSIERPVSASSSNKATSNCFIPLDSSYSAIPRNDDGSFGPIALPFTFDLYGSSYTQVWINTNGNLTFTGAYSSFTSTGFPFTQPMVAPFWADVDTRNTAGGQIHYKLSATNLIVTWDNVGYYSQQVDKLNEFQVVISDGLDPLTGLGQNVCFNYGDMQWTTGSASSGVGGFGGVPATVGVNKGNNTDFYQLGRFGVNSAIYDGPGGNTDGVDYLDQQCYCSQVSSAVNIAPIANQFPSDTINIDCGELYTLDFSFIPPEVNQTVSTTINISGTCGTTYTSTSGSISDINFTLLGQQCNEGLNTITFTATDNGTPVESTTVALYVNVGTCCDLTASSTGQDESCANQSDGSISVSTTGGTAPLSYSIDGGTTYTSSPNFTGLATGSYVVIAQDVNGCESLPQTIVISGPTQLASSSSSTAILCNGGSSTLTVTASGGTPAYTGIGNFTVSAGPYSYTVTDANGCTSVTTGVVSEPAALVASASATTILCNGGTSDITVVASGGTAPYTGTGVNTELAGTYTNTVTDANGCSADVTITVTEPTVLTASATSTSIDCNGGTSDVTVVASGGTAPYTGEGTFSVTAGTYSYTITDANGCIETVTITVTEPAVLVASASAAAILCNGGSTDVTVTATGGTAPYSGVGTFNETVGTYTYTVTDANGCTSSTTVTLTEPTLMTAFASCPAILCNGGTTDLGVTAFGGTPPYTGTGVFNLGAGTYTFVITDANGCTASVTHTITELDPVDVTITSTGIDCYGGTADLTVSATGGTGPYSGEGTFTVGQGTYTYTVTDTNGCTGTATITITEPAPLVASTSADSILCNGGSADVTVTATGGTAPYTGTGTFSQAAGTVTYTVTDANGCTTTTTVTLGEPTLMTAYASCPVITTIGGTADLGVTAFGGTPGYTGTGIFNVGVGTYTFVVTDANGCTASVTHTVTGPGSLNTQNVINSTGAGTNVKLETQGNNINMYEDVVEDANRLELGDIYPNPILSSNGRVNFDLRTAQKSDVTVRIYDFTGKTMMTDILHLEEGPNACVLDVTGYASGSYVIEVTSGDNKETTRLIVQ